MEEDGEQQQQPPSDRAALVSECKDLERQIKAIYSTCKCSRGVPPWVVLLRYMPSRFFTLLPDNGPRVSHKLCVSRSVVYVSSVHCGSLGIEWKWTCVDHQEVKRGIPSTP